MEINKKALIQFGVAPSDILYSMNNAIGYVVEDADGDTCDSPGQFEHIHETYSGAFECAAETYGTRKIDDDVIWYRDAAGNLRR